MSNQSVNPGSLRAVAGRLDQMGMDYVFVGGSIVGFLLDHPSMSPVRATDDVDVILEVVASFRYSSVEEKLRKLDFEHDTTEGVPMCRWKLGTLTVDIMPTDGAHLGLNTIWFQEALESSSLQDIGGQPLRLVSPVAFLATKYAAFCDRGNSDYYGSSDLEDFITVVDGRANIVTEIDSAPSSLRQFVIESIQSLQKKPAFRDALPGHLPSDEANQRRLPGLHKKLLAIEKL